MVPHHTASPGRYQCLAQAIQPDQTSSRIEHAPTRPRNLIRETKNQWANLGGWTEAAADLLRLELEPFRRYDRVPFVNVSIKDDVIRIRATVQKTSAKAVSYNWLNESYKVTSTGGLFFNDGYHQHPLACDAGQIVEHFLALHKAKITARFETAMKDKRHGSDNAYIKDGEQKLGRSSIF